MVETSSKSYKEVEEKKTDRGKVMVVVEVNTIIICYHGLHGQV